MSIQCIKQCQGTFPDMGIRFSAMLNHSDGPWCSFGLCQPALPQTMSKHGLGVNTDQWSLLRGSLDV